MVIFNSYVSLPEGIRLGDMLTFIPAGITSASAAFTYFSPDQEHHQQRHVKSSQWEALVVSFNSLKQFYHVVNL